MKTRINLNQLATLHLSKTNPIRITAKPSLSQLASMSLSPKDPSPSPNLKPNLAALHLSQTNPIKITAKPSLSQLASMSLSPKDPSPNPKPNLAALHLSQTNPIKIAAKPSLSQLASMSLSPKDPSPNPKPNLAALHSSQTNPIKITAKPSLSLSLKPKLNLAELAKMNLNKSNEKEESKTGLASTNLNLTSALRSKCTVTEKRSTPSLKHRKQDLESLVLTPIKAERTVDPALILKNPSRLGRVMSKHVKSCQTLFLKFDLQSRMTDRMKAVEPFAFDSPSPDDLIQRRLRGFTKE